MADIKVRNNSADVVTGRYDGVDYAFPPGKAVVVAEEVAQHIFGYGEDDKMSVLQRLGWLLNSEQLATAKEKLKNFVFSSANPHYDDPDPPQAPEENQVPVADSSAAGKGRSKAATTGEPL